MFLVYSLCTHLAESVGVGSNRVDCTAYSFQDSEECRDLV